jgi:hypothetical protein
MSRDLEALLAPIAPSDNEPLDTLDPRLATVLDLADQRRFSDAADKAEDLIRAGVFDVRPISVLLFDAYLKDGLRALPPVLRAVALLVGENLTAVGPIKRREDQFDRRLTWLFESIIDSLKFHDKKRSDEWVAWHDGLKAEVVVDAKTIAESIGVQIKGGAFKTTEVSIAHLIDWLRPHIEQVKAMTGANKPTEVAPIVSPSEGAERAETPALSTAIDALDPVRRRVELEVSHAFIELITKVKVFEQLVDKGDLERAALVSDDIQQLLESFDPRMYFPELFGRYCKLLSKNIDEISTHWGERDSVAWRTYSQLYRMNPRGFLEE